MRTVQIYVGRGVTDLDCIRVTFTLDGVTETIDVPLTGTLNGKPEYEYNLDLSEGDYIITEGGDYITTETGDYLITDSSIFTPSIHIYWDGTQWVCEIIVNGVTYEYCSNSDVYYPFLTNWEKCDCDCIKVTYQLIGESPVTVEVASSGIFNGKNYYEIVLIEGESPSVLAWDITGEHPNQWELDADNIPHLDSDTPCPFGTYTIEEGSIFESFVVEPCNVLEYLVTTPCTDLKYERLELFDDEKISVTLNVQNISDLSKTFTDFSQSFTVPGSVTNNKIFEHFYQNDVDGTIDYNLKRPAYIEIDFIPFRQGVISLEKANIKNGVVDNYSISFFGQLTNLKDIFGEIKINQLNLSSLEFAYNATNVQNRITDTATDYDVRFPLIANNRLWTYADGGAEDITLTANSIAYTELFPAVKVARLFDAIQTDFNLTFEGAFFEDERFTELFLEAKNATTLNFITEPQIVDFTSRTNLITGNNPYSVADYVSIPNDTITVSQLLNVTRQQIQVNVTTKSAAGTGYLDVFKNGIYNRTFEFTTTGGIPNFISHVNYSGGDIVYSFQLRASAPMSIGIVIVYSIRTLIDGQQDVNQSTISTATNVLTGNLSVSNYLPDMKVSDFFSGILKQFNMTCVGIDQNTFQILPLEDWYNSGATIDVTKYINAETTDISRVPLYRNIGFQYQQSESFANRNFFAISNSEYGNTNNAFNYDGGDYIIESPFENLLFVEAVGTVTTDTAILGYFLNSNYQSYIPKPTLLYMYGNTGTLPVNIKFYNGTTNVNLTNYTLFGQDLLSGGENYSLNFGADNSIILKETIQNGLFATYYFSYLSNLYNLKQRLTVVSSMLPLSIITNLRLNDRLIIRDKRYIINDIKTELTTGEAQLTLYNDFRDIDLDNYLVIGSGAQNVLLNVEYKSGSNLATITRTPATVAISPTTISWGIDDFRTKNYVVTVPANTTGFSRRWVISINYINVGVVNFILIQEA